MHRWPFARRNADLERELQADLELEEQEQKELGLPQEDAHYAARRAFGNSALIREQVHEAWGWASTERLCQDIRYAIRQLARSPGFTAMAVMTLALGIGATTAIFTLVYDAMLRPLPFAQPDRLVNIEEIATEWSSLYPRLPVSANHFTFWQQPNRSFDSMAVMQQGSVPLGSEGRPLQVGVLSSTHGLFSVLRVQPQLGRAFTDGEAQPGKERVVVLMHDLWREQFGSDPAIVGKTIRLSGFPYTVIGVIPASFHMPAVQTMATIGGRNRPLPVEPMQALRTE